jgi:hypothetical protein
VVVDLSEREARRVLSENVDVAAHLMSDEWKSFVSIGQAFADGRSAFAAHDTVRHSDREYVRGPNAGAWRVHVWRSLVSWRSSCTAYGLTAPSSVGPNKPRQPHNKEEFKYPA